MTPSPLQSDTARANGAHSHGPVTPEGKAASAMNSLRHGLCSKQTLLPGEDPAEFERYRASYLQIYKPQSEPEKDQVEILVATNWRLKRILRLESILLADENADPLHTLALLTRYEGQLNRTHDRALKHLKELQQARIEAARLEAAARAAKSAPQRNEPSPARAAPPQMSEKDVELAIRSIVMAPIPGSKGSGGSR